MSSSSRAWPAPGIAAALGALGALALLGCTDAPGTAPRAVPRGFDAALAVVVADPADTPSAVTADRAARSSAAASALGGPDALGLSAAADALAVAPPPINLGNFGPCCAFPEDINDQGQVVGRAPTLGKCPEMSDGFRAVLWTKAGGLRNLGTIGGGWSGALGVNEAGQVVGRSVTAEDEERAFLWEAGSGMRHLGTLGGEWSQAVAINAAGQVVGTSVTAAGEERAFLWEEGAGMRDLGTLGGPSAGSSAVDINDLGQVIGIATRLGEDGTYLFGPFLWDAAGGMRAIGEGPGTAEVYALAINNRGQVLISSGYVWEEGRPPVPIGPLPPSIRGVSLADINDRGQVVGAAGGPNIGSLGFLWEPGAGFTLLPPLPGDGSAYTTALNDRGQVVGVSFGVEGCDGDTVAPERAVLWTVESGGEGAPVVDRLHAAVLPPGVVPGLSGIWLRVRLTDEGDPGPWDWAIDWGDDTPPSAPQDVKYTGEFAFLRAAPYTAAGPHTITVTATDPGGVTSTAATVVVP